MYLIEKVELYNVNGYTLCAIAKKDMEEYLEDVPEQYIKNKDYEGKGCIILTEKEVEGFYCKEIDHMKINRIFRTEEEAELYRMYIVERLAQ